MEQYRSGAISVEEVIKKNLELDQHISSIEYIRTQENAASQVSYTLSLSRARKISLSRALASMFETVKNRESGRECIDCNLRRAQYFAI